MSAEKLMDASQERRLREACADLDRRIRAGESVRAEDYIAVLSDTAKADDSALELIYTEYSAREQCGQRLRAEDWFDRFPTWRDALARLFEIHELAKDTRLPSSDTEPPADSPFRSASAKLVGTRIGQYELVEEVGRGGMGVVYKARQLGLDRTVAIKMILAFQATRQIRTRFRQEAETIARLHHPNIVQIYEAGEQDGCSFLSMEYVDGKGLDNVLLHSTLTPTCAAALIETLARAMHYAHGQGVIHRDLKPANVLLAAVRGQSSVKGALTVQLHGNGQRSSDFVPKIADFGLAKRFADGPNVTGTGQILGTPSYMAPEQANGNSAAIGPSADVYALGAIMYEILCGRAPFQGDTPLDTLVRVRMQDPLNPRRLRPKLPRDLETICLKCLAKEPHKRYETAEQLANDLRRFMVGEPIVARPVSAWERTAKWARRRPAAAALIAALVLGFASVTWQWFRAETSRAQAVLAADSAEAARRAEADARSHVERLLYFHSVVLAHHEYLSNNTERARQSLDGCRAELRGWEWHYLKRLCNADVMTLKGHSLPVRDVAWSSDGKLIASSSAMWNVDRQGEVKVWNAATGEEVFTLRGHPRDIYCVAFSPDGKTLASGGAIDASERAGVKLWDLSDGAEIGSISRVASVMSLAFSPTGKLLAVGSLDGKVRLCDPTTAKMERTLSGHTDCVYGVAFSPDGSRLASCGGHDRTARLWNVADGRQLALIPVGDDARYLSFSPEGQHIAISTYMGRIKIWDIARNIEIASHPYHELGPHANISPDGRSLAVVGGDGLVQLWRATTGERQRTFRGHSSITTDATFSPDGRRLATSSLDRTVRVWDLTSGTEPRSISVPDATMRGVGYSPDGQLLALVAGPGDPTARKPTMLLWNVASGTQLAPFPGVTHHLTSVTFSPDGKRLVTGSVNKSVQLWDVDARRLVRSFQGHTEPVTSVGFNRDGGRIVSGGSDKTVKVWETESERLLFSVDACAAGVTVVAFSPDDKHIASASSDGTLNIRDASDGRGLVELRCHSQAIRRLAFSHDGRLLATAGDDTTISLWDVPAALHGGRESQPVLTLRGHNEPVTGLDFSPDDQRLVTVAGDHRLKLWDVTTGQEALTVHVRAAPESQVLFSPDGQRIVMSSHGLKVYDLADEQFPTDEARAQDARLRAIAWHEMSARECEREGDWFAASFHLGQLVELEPDTRPFKQRLTTARAKSSAERGEWAAAATEFEKLIALGGDSASTWYSLAVLRVATNDWEGYRAACTKLLDTYRDTEDARVLNAIAWRCVLSPESGHNPDSVVQLAERSVAKSRKPSSLNTLGAALFRAGRHEESVQCLNQSLAARGQGGVVEDWLFLAMAHAQLGNAAAARDWFGKATQWLDQATYKFETSNTAVPSQRWQDRITFPLLRREAEALLAQPPRP